MIAELVKSYRGVSMLAVVDRTELVHIQKLGQFARIDPVTLTAILQ